MLTLPPPLPPTPPHPSQTNGDNEIWNLCPQPDQLAAVTAAMRLRESLRGYVAQLSAEHSATGMPLMRPMFLQWPADAGCAGADVEDQYSFGDSWVVKPITAPQVASASVYLPSLAGTNLTWTYWWNQTSVGQGGARVTVNTPLTEFPLFRLTRPL